MHDQLIYLGIATVTICALARILLGWADDTITIERRHPIIADMCESCRRYPARTTVTNTDKQDVHVCHGCLDKGMANGWWTTEQRAS